MALIRPYEERDWPAVLAIVREVIEEGETYALPADLDDDAIREFWLGDECCLVAVVKGQVLGTARCGPNRPAQGSHVGTASFMVAAAARGQGIGRALGEGVLDWLESHDYLSVQFNAVVASNLRAVRLWQDLGFVIIGTVPHAFELPDGRLEGLHIMYLELTS